MKNPAATNLTLLGELFDAVVLRDRPDAVHGYDATLGGGLANFTYTARNRDAVKGAVPEEGLVEKSGSRTVVYNRILTQEEIDKYDLLPLGAEKIIGESNQKPFPKSNVSDVIDALNLKHPNDWRGVKVIYNTKRSDIKTGLLYGDPVVNAAYATPADAVVLVAEQDPPRIRGTLA